MPAGEVAALVPLKPGELFLESQLAAGVAAILGFYRQRGFAAVDVKSAVNETDPPRAEARGLGCRAAIVIAEGSRSMVGEVRITGTSAVPADELRPLVKINAGDPYFEPRIVEARDALVLEYLNRGFAVRRR